MIQPLSATAMRRLLDKVYELALRGLPKTPTAQELGDGYLARYGDPEVAIGKLINWQAAKCSASGFLTGLGGILTVPLAVPADFAATYYVSVRMVAAIAHLRGHDLGDEATRAAVFVCLLGDAAAEVVKQAGVEMALGNLPRVGLKRLNDQTMVKLATRAGEIGGAKLGRFAPLAGALVGAALNATACKAIGRTARAHLPRIVRVPVQT
jgi:hypothetical protein